MGGQSLTMDPAALLRHRICSEKLAKAEQHCVKAGLLSTTGLVPVQLAATSLVR